MVSIRKNIRFLGILILLVFLFIAHQSIQNKHAHFCDKGVIVHSHPLNKNTNSPAKSHSHSKTEICIYHLLNFEYFFHTGELHLKAGTNSFPLIVVPENEQPHYDVWFCNTDTRDPPFI